MKLILQNKQIFPHCILFLFISWLGLHSGYAQEFVCGTGHQPNPSKRSVSTSRTIDQHTGAHLPPRDTIRALIYYIQFPEDTRPDEFWESGNIPVWAEKLALDLTDYFRQMSRGDLVFIAETHPRVLILPRREVDYIVENQNYGHASREIIRMLDTEYDFSRFDLWNAQDRAYRIEKSPEGRVDLVLQIYRSAGWNFLPFSGVSDMGFEGYVFVDSMQRYFYGGNGSFSDAASSGVTLVNHSSVHPVTNHSFAFGVGAHEILHKIYGEGHPARLFGGLGLLGSSGSGMGLNSFERHALGIITMTPIPYGVDTLITLRDYMTTGEAAYLPIAQRPDLFYSFEYRTRRDKYDTAPARGLYIYRIDDSGGRNQKEVIVQSADGKWEWMYDSSLSRIVKARPDPLNGYNKLQAIPYGGRNMYAWGWWGDSTDAFTLENPYFSWWRNPTPDFVMGIDTIRTNLDCRIVSMSDSSLVLSLTYGSNGILSARAVQNPTLVLYQNYPHPVSADRMTTFRFSLAKQAHIRMKAYNIVGGTRHPLVDGEFSAGVHEVTTHLRDIPAGTYILTLETREQMVQRLFQVLK